MPAKPKPALVKPEAPKPEPSLYKAIREHLETKDKETLHDRTKKAVEAVECLLEGVQLAADVSGPSETVVASVVPTRIPWSLEGLVLPSFPGAPVPDSHPEIYPEIQIPFPSVDAYAEDDMHPEATSAFLAVRESLDTHLVDLLETVRAMRVPASPEDVRRLCQVRTVVLGALETMS